MNVSFHPVARDEMFDSALHYETKRTGLGREFRAEVMRGAKLLGEHPRIGPMIDDDVFRLVLNKFPYSLVYCHSTIEVLILAVAHHRKKPGFWRARVDA